MGAWRKLGETAALAALLCASRASAGTVMEPIARLYLEGGYDSNALSDGRGSDQTARVSPDVGVRLRSPRLDFRTTYGGELVYFQRFVPEGRWNHRAGMSVDTRPTRRTRLTGDLRAAQAFDPAGLAVAGVFRTGRQDALILTGSARFDWRATRRVDTALTMTERTVLFEDGNGGAMHAPTAEALWRFGRRLALGAAYGAGYFQEFVRAAPDETAFSQALRARARWRATRHVAVEAAAGPALWIPSGGTSIVPEAFLEMLIATRGFDLRVGVGHALGIAATARPGVVDSAEVGAERRFGRRYILRGDGGLWRSGSVPSGSDAVTGFLIGGEAGILFGDLRLSLAGSHAARVDDPAGDFNRSTLGLRVGWEIATHRRRRL